MVRQHHQFNGHEFEQAPEDVEDRGAWHATVHEVTKSQTGLSDFHLQLSLWSNSHIHT